MGSVVLACDDGGRDMFVIPCGPGRRRAVTGGRGSVASEEHCVDDDSIDLYTCFAGDGLLSVLIFEDDAYATLPHSVLKQVRRSLHGMVAVGGGCSPAARADELGGRQQGLWAGVVHPDMEISTPHGRAVAQATLVPCW